MSAHPPRLRFHRFHAGDSAEGLCQRCGMKGRHSSWDECITQLRDTIAVLEIEILRLQPSHGGRPRKTAAALA
ncbi:MAG TPA: hypothetical protein VFD98_09065 [Terracidiphilus sp.]|nr:hypothetical protein [Terracidiphilus sp.]